MFTWLLCILVWSRSSAHEASAVGRMVVTLLCVCINPNLQCWSFLYIAYLVQIPQPCKCSNFSLKFLCAEQCVGFHVQGCARLEKLKCAIPTSHQNPGIAQPWAAKVLSVTPDSPDGCRASCPFLQMAMVCVAHLFCSWRSLLRHGSSSSMLLLTWKDASQQTCHRALARTIRFLTARRLNIVRCFFS